MTTEPAPHNDVICQYYGECYCGCVLCDVACRGLMPGQEEPFYEDDAPLDEEDGEQQD